MILISSISQNFGWKNNFLRPFQRHCKLRIRHKPPTWHEHENLIYKACFPEHWSLGLLSSNDESQKRFVAVLTVCTRCLQNFLTQRFSVRLATVNAGKVDIACC